MKRLTSDVNMEIGKFGDQFDVRTTHESVTGHAVHVRKLPGDTTEDDLIEVSLMSTHHSS